MRRDVNNAVLIPAEPPRDCIYMDRVLHQIHDNKGLFKEESVDISCFWEHLRPWLDLFESKGHESVLNRRRDPGPLWELVDLLLESRNRVWARVFIETLGRTLHIKPKLQLWAQQLDNTGAFHSHSRGLYHDGRDKTKPIGLCWYHEADHQLSLSTPALMLS